MLRPRSANPLVELIESRCCAPEMILTRHPLNFGAAAFTFVNAARVLLTHAVKGLSVVALTLLTSPLTL